MAEKKKRPDDVNVIASQMVSDTTRDNYGTETTKGKNPAAVALGRLGGLKGGRARAEKLSPQRRSAIARKAANSRWSKKA